MLYPDFKMRYAILGAAEIASSSDNKVATYALMDKDIVLATLLCSSELVPLQVLRRQEMTLLSSYLECFKAKHTNISKQKSLKRNVIRGSSLRLPNATSENIWLSETGDGL